MMKYQKFLSLFKIDGFKNVDYIEVDFYILFKTVNDLCIKVK